MVGSVQEFQSDYAPQINYTQFIIQPNKDFFNNPILLDYGKLF
jgi:hypothetical protein